ncbi:uncharacterized protein [Nicotiana tomentosiformis]|uniref:uncharacterized protein n=1 Tax=Nicotiana tomentosiformis TaxID=4098 RepID=UPI00388CA273
MTAKSSTGETPFSLEYDAEALIPVEVGELTLRIFRANEEANNEAFLVKLDLLDARMERYSNRRANYCYFKVGDLVLRKVTHITREINALKMDPTWEGPYRVSVVTILSQSGFSDKVFKEEAMENIL